jgi:hypothetical protein
MQRLVQFPGIFHVESLRRGDYRPSRGLQPVGDPLRGIPSGLDNEPHAGRPDFVSLEARVEGSDETSEAGADLLPGEPARPEGRCG